MLWTFKIWDKRRIRVFEDGEWIQVPHPTDTAWIKKDCDIELNEIRIVSFQEDEIFADEVKSKKCTQVFLSDGDDVLAAYPMDKFRELYKNEYLKAVLATIVINNQGGEESA